MTPTQVSTLAVVRAVNARDYADWFLLSSPMAVIQIESAFKQYARRYEPRIHDASYGYMQLLSGTAAGLRAADGTELYRGPVFPHMPDPGDIVNNPRVVDGTLYDPAVNISCGLRYLHDGWDHLRRAFGRDPTLSEWFAGYNEGYGAAARGRPDPAYVAVALAAFEHWLPILNETERASALVR